MRLLTIGFAFSAGLAGVAYGKTIELNAWHHLASKVEVDAVTAAIERFNNSQARWRIVLDAIPEVSYTQSIMAAARADVLPCLVEVDQPLVPYFAWNEFIAPLDKALSKELLQSINKYGKGTFNNRVYSAGQFDAALALFTRKSLLKEIGSRTPTLEHPWTKGELMAVLAKIKARGDYVYPFDMRTNERNEWIPYAFGPLMLSWGADMIERDTYQRVDGVMNSPKAVAFGEWVYSLIENGYMELNPADDKGLLNGRVAIQYNGSWALKEYSAALGDDLAVLPVPDFGEGTVIGAGSWHWAISQSCASPEGASAFLSHMLSPAEIAAISDATGLIPTTKSAAALTERHSAVGEWRVFYDFAESYSRFRPETPVYPVISSKYKKAITDILEGEDPELAFGLAVESIEQAIERQNSFR